MIQVSTQKHDINVQYIYNKINKWLAILLECVGCFLNVSKIKFLNLFFFMCLLGVKCEKVGENIVISHIILSQLTMVAERSIVIANGQKISF